MRRAKHTGSRRDVIQRVNQDESSSGAVIPVIIIEQGGTCFQDDTADMVQRKLCRMAAFQCIDVYVVLEFCYPPLDISARMANHVFASGKKGFFRHPDDTGFQPILDMGEIPFFDDHVTAADIYFILKFQYDGLGRECFFQVSVRSNNPSDPAVLKRRQRHDRVPPADGAGSNGAGEPPEIEIGAYDCLYRKAEIPEIPAVAGIQRFRMESR